MQSFAIGVDMGGTNLRIAAVDAQGALLRKITTATKTPGGRDQAVAAMRDAIHALAAQFKTSHTLLGAGIGVPGIIDLETGMLHESPNLPDWNHYQARQQIEAALSMPAILDNDANVAALGESWLGAAREVEFMCMLTLGTGVGGGMVLNRRLWRGMNGMANEFGHITVDPEGAPCGCGNHGCLEQYASATALVRMAREVTAEGNAPVLARALQDNQQFSARDLYQLAMQGEPVAREIFCSLGRTLGIALAGLINALNLPMYVVGGGVSAAWDLFAPAMLEEIKKRSFVYAATAPDSKGNAARQTRITRALLGSEAGLYGAARLAMLAAQGNPAEAEYAAKGSVL